MEQLKEVKEGHTKLEVKTQCSWSSGHLWFVVLESNFPYIYLEQDQTH